MVSCYTLEYDLFFKSSFKQHVFSQIIKKNKTKKNYLKINQDSIQVMLHIFS